MQGRYQPAAMLRALLALLICSSERLVGNGHTQSPLPQNGVLISGVHLHIATTVCLDGLALSQSQ